MRIERFTWPRREPLELGDCFNSSGAGGYFIGGKPPIIKSIQRGVIALTGATSNTATITSVDTANSVVIWLGENSTYNSDSQTRPCYVGLTLTNATTVTANRTNNTNNASVSYEVIEYTAGYLKSVQRGTQAVTGATTNVTISSVSTSLTQLGFMGHQEANVGTAFTGDSGTTYAQLTTATNIAIKCNNAAGTNTYHWQATEWNP